MQCEPDFPGEEGFIARKIVIAAAGSGGHLLPAQTIAKELSEHSITFMGVGLDTNPYFGKQWPSVSVSGDALKGAKSVGKILRGIWQSIWALKRADPELIIGYGSYHTFPILVAARLLKIPYMLYESNAQYGKVNRLFAQHAIGVGSLLKKLPFSTQVAGPKPLISGEKSAKTLLVFGGSQGAQTLNAMFLKIASQLDLEVIHLIGKHGNFEEISAFYQREEIKVCVKVFEENMEMAYNRANLAICRAGAATIAELLAYRLPAVLIPFPYASEGHQLVNARLMESEGGAIVIEEKDLTPETLLEAINKGLEREEEMRGALQGCSKSERKTSFKEMILTHLGEA